MEAVVLCERVSELWAEPLSPLAEAATLGDTEGDQLPHVGVVSPVGDP